MNLQDWINTGIIEAYVLGDLTDQEVREVEAMADRHPEVRDEIHSVSLTFEELARKSAVAPPAGMRDRILAAATADNTDNESSTPVVPVTPREDGSTHIKRRHTPMPWKYGLAASVALLLLTSVLAFNYRSLWQDAEERLESYIVENQQVRQDYQVLRSNYQSLKELQNIYADPSFDRIPLNGTDAFPSSFATVYWKASSREVYLAPAGLPEPTDGKQYQLWAIVDGEPKSAGMINDLKGLNVMQEISNASAFAITLEPEGGSKAPTMEAMYVLGEV
ncbi:MAG: anti-sigma factor [Cyclobacteriaceae bacterium]